ncbi:hypothetical protein KXS07_03235 [Inquilinus limosus]|uniref:hypothetical protein n=1 Tax=Inquilinus limosus TaxID=171674 RepID=UPI003F183DAD
MMRFFGLAILLMALSACAAQVSQPSPLLGAPPFQAVAPAGYCLSDESDKPGAIVKKLVMGALSDSRMLAMFRPCDETLPKTRPAAWSFDRLIFSISPAPVIYVGGPAIDRELFITFLANPKLAALWKQRNMPADRPENEGTIYDVRYLGFDGSAVYNGIIWGHVDPRSHDIGRAHTVFGQTVVGQSTLRVDAISLTNNRLPRDLTVLQEIAAQAIRATIAAAEHPMRTPMPSPQPPQTTGPAGQTA